MELAKDIEKKVREIPEDIEIVAATKYVEAEDMCKLFTLGIYSFGENREDALLKKYDALSKEPIRWHFIGHLQTNKAKKVLPNIEVLHSLDSLKLAKEIEKIRTTPLDCYVEVNMNKEASKHGVLEENCESFLKEILSYSKVHIVGLMMMTTKNSSYEEKVEQFQGLKKLMSNLNQKLNLKLHKLSMGMSDDYLAAIEAGTTTIRLGRMLWEIPK